MNILISDAFEASLPGKLARFGNVTEDKNAVAQADIILVRSKTKCTKEYIDNAKSVKMIIRGGVGLDNIDVEYAKQKGIIVKNTASASSIAVAELAFSLMIAIPNRVVEGDTSMRQGKWLKKELERTELYEKTLGLIGVGNIGTEVAKRAVGFGMTVIAYDPAYKMHSHAQMVGSVEEVVKDADYISLHVPLIDSTKGLVNKALIAKMKDGVKIINTARAKVVVEEDMVEALTSGKIGAYATDVWVGDPPDFKSPLFSAPNTIFTPHIGASSAENLNRIGDVIVDILDAYQKK